MARNISSKILSELGANRIRRVRWKHMAILGCVAMVLLLSFPLLRFYNDRRVRNSAMAQAEVAKKNGEVDLALRHIDRYLATHPEDVPALEVKAQILSEVDLYQTQLIEAAKSLDLLVRLDPKGKGREETRRKLADLYIRYSDDLKRYAETSSDPDVERQQSRYTAAASIAKQLVDESVAGGYGDPVAHKLLAKAYEGQISDLRARTKLTGGGPNAQAKKSNMTGEDDLRVRAIQHYKTAIELDPHDLESATRLANIYAEWTKDRLAADQVLDAMLKANPESVDARLRRYRAFIGQKRDGLTPEEIKKRDDDARRELEAVLKLAPDNVEVRLNIAQVALGRRDPNSLAEARRQLDAIPAAKQEEDLRIKILRGYMEFAEQHPDDAIDQWKRGLLLVGGSDQDLTWRLAYNLVQLGRYNAAEPLRQQYFRLAKGDRNGLGKFLDALFDMGYGRLYEARKKLEKIKDIVSNTYKVDVLVALGRCCDMMGDAEAALIAYRNAAAASPGSASPRLMIARSLQKRQPDEAIAEVDRALADSPDETYLLLESIRLRLLKLAARPAADPKRVRELEDLFRRLEAVAPTNPTLLSYRADYLAVTGQLSKAVDTLAEAVKGKSRKLPEVWITLAQGLDRMNRRDQAIRALDQASLPENAGDHAKFRIAKARLLAMSGKGQEARKVLTNNPEGVGVDERPELAQARAELLRELGDRQGAIEAYSDWAKLAPNVPGPALSLLAMAQVDHDDNAAKQGLEALKKVGGDQEPYGIAARALELLRTDPTRPAPPSTERLFEADLLVKRLRQEAPSLRLGSLLEGMVFELKKDLEGAARAYKAALKDDLVSPALPKLIEVYIKLKRFDELGRLRRDFEEEVEARQRPGLMAEFDRIAAAASMKLGDRDRADYFASRLIEERRDDVAARRAVALMLVQNNQPDQAEESLKALVKEKPNDSDGWLTLIAVQALRKLPADVARTIVQARRDYRGDRPELFLAKCYWLGKDFPNAKDAFKKAVDLRADDIVTLQALAQFYEQTNQGALAEPVLRKALKVDPSAIWAARALALKLSDRPDPSTWPEAWALVAPGSSTSSDTPEDRLIRATILARSPDVRRREEAVPAFVALVNDLPISSPLAIDTRLKLAQAMIDVGRFVEAWDAIRPVADDLARPNALALMLAIEALARSNQPDEAQRRHDRLNALDPKSPQVPLASSWILKARGRTAEAVAALEAAYKGSSAAPNAEVVGMLAVERMIRFGDLEASLRVAEEIARRWPADAWQLGRVHVLRKEFDRALSACEVALGAGSPREALRHATSAAVSHQDGPGFISKVIELGARAKAKDPKDYNIPIFLATLQHIRGHYEDEMACYREALELYPSNVQFLNNMAWTLCEGLHRPQEAMKYIEEAIQREGEFPQHLDTRGVIEEQLGLLDRAIADLEKSVKGDPSAATYFHLARAYWKANDMTSSRRSRDLAIKAKFNPAELDPTDRRDLEKVMGTP